MLAVAARDTPQVPESIIDLARLLHHRHLDAAKHRRFRHRRRMLILRMLGEKCAECGSTRGLEIDHIDPDSKGYPSHRIWSLAWAKIAAELPKCQLLCHKHHEIKTARENAARANGHSQAEKGDPQ